MNRTALALALLALGACLVAWPHLPIGERGPLRVVVVEESADRSRLSLDVRLAIRSDALKAAARDAGARLEIVDKDEPSEAVRPYTDAARAFGRLPAWTYRYGTGDVRAMECPDTEQSAIELVRKQSGVAR